MVLGLRCEELETPLCLKVGWGAVLQGAVAMQPWSLPQGAAYLLMALSPGECVRRRSRM